MITSVPCLGMNRPTECHCHTPPNHIVVASGRPSASAPSEPDFAVEPADGFGRPTGGKREELQGHDAVHPPVPRPVDPPHPSLANLFQDDVVADDQTLGLALDHQVGLELGQLLATQHLLDESSSTARLLVQGQIVEEVVHLIDGDEADLRKVFDELLERDSHIETRPLAYLRF